MQNYCKVSENANLFAVPRAKNVCLYSFVSKKVLTSPSVYNVG